MAAISDDNSTLKFVHTYGAGLHSGDADPDVYDPRWQQRQVEDFVDFAVLAEELGFDGVTVTEHHAPLMVCPSPHLLLAAAAVRTSRIRLGTAVTVLPLYSPLRVAEEAGMLDLLSGGRFELGLGRGVPREALFAVGRDLGDDDLRRAWHEALEVVQLALTQRDFTYEGEFFPVERPTTIATSPLQHPLPVWLGGSSRETMRQAAVRGWNVMRNFGSHADHRNALEDYVKVAAGSGHTRSGANMMVERFVAIGETEDQAERNLDKLARAFGRFLSLYLAGGGRAVPETDAEFHAGSGAPRHDQPAPHGPAPHGPALHGPAQPGRPAIAVSGTPDQVIDALQEVIDETGARRLLVETFSREETRLLAREVIPVLKKRNGAG